MFSIGLKQVMTSSSRNSSSQTFTSRSFNVPYKVQLLWPSVESLNCVSVEPDTDKCVRVDEEADRDEEEEEEVAYERLRGCGDASCEDVLDETSSSLRGSPENQFKHNGAPITETHKDVLAPHRVATSSQSTSPSFTPHSLALKTPILELQKNDSALCGSTTGDGHDQEEEEEDSDDVNFFSITIGGQNIEQREEAEKEERMEKVLKVKREGPLFVSETLKPSLDIQHTSFESTSRHISYSEDDEEEDTEEEDAFSGYMMRS